jgi:hypothetical protein
MNRIRLEYPQVRIEGAEDGMKPLGRTSSDRHDATIRDQNLYLKGGQYE